MPALQDLDGDGDLALIRLDGNAVPVCLDNGHHRARRLTHQPCPAERAARPRQVNRFRYAVQVATGSKPTLRFAASIPGLRVAFHV